jgi:hypothetical protein
MFTVPEIAGFIISGFLALGMLVLAGSFLAGSILTGQVLFAKDIHLNGNTESYDGVRQNFARLFYILYWLAIAASIFIALRKKYA